MIELYKNARKNFVLNNFFGSGISESRNDPFGKIGKLLTFIQLKWLQVLFFRGN